MKRRLGQAWPRAPRTALALTIGAVLTGCSPASGLPEPPEGTLASTTGPVPTFTVDAEGPVAPSVTLPPIEEGHAPAQPFVVDRREIAVTRDDRPLRTVIFYPISGLIGGTWDVADGVFPLILFSHGLHGSPEIYEQNLRAIAAAGFVVAAPAYPHTSADAAEYNPVDLLNQPTDASTVITAVLALAEDADDPLAGHIDPARVAAMGHSAGGYTTLGLLTSFRDRRVRAAVVLAGASLGGSFTEPALPVLFVHGEADPVVPYDSGRAAYDQVPWPKAFLTVVDAGHSDYLYRNSLAAKAVTATVLDFLRATLYGDADALSRIPVQAAVDGVTVFESNL